MSNGNRKRRRLRGDLPEPATCTATTSAGNPCRSAPVTGARVCWHHGGAAPQVKRKAEERIAAAADPAAAKLVELMSSKKVPYSVQLAAAKDLLDRAGIGRERGVTVTLKKWEEGIDGLIVDLPPGNRYDDDDVVDGEVVEPDPLPAAPPHDGPYPGPQPPQYGTGYTTDGFGR